MTKTTKRHSQLSLNLRAGVTLPQYRAAAGRRKLASNYRGKIESALKPIVKADAKAVRARAAENIGLGAFLLWVESYFRDREDPTREAVEGIYESLATDTAAMAASEIGSDPPADRVSGFAGGFAKNFAHAWRGRSTAQLQNLATSAGEENYIAAIDERLTEWVEGGQGSSRARKHAGREAVTLANAVATLVFFSAGYGLVWVTFGANCPYCDDLAGKRVANGESFLGDGEFNPKGADRPIKIRGGLSYPPSHAGCDCSIAPG